MPSKAIKNTLFVGLTLLLLWWTCRDLKFGQLAEALYASNYFWITLCFLSSVLAQFARAWRWKMQLDATDYQATIMQSYHALMVGNITNIVTPHVGELTRCSALKRTAGFPFPIVLGTVIAEHIIDFILLLSSILLAVLLCYAELSGLLSELWIHYFYPALYLFTIAGILLLSAGVIWFMHKRHVSSGKGRWPLLDPIIEMLISGVASWRQVKHKMLFLLVSLLVWFCYFLKGLFAIWALQLTADSGFIEAIAVLAFGTLAMWAPVHGGFGVFHLTVQTLLLAFGISSEQALIFAFVLHSVQTMQIILFGCWSLYVVFKKVLN